MRSAIAGLMRKLLADDLYELITYLLLVAVVAYAATIEMKGAIVNVNTAFSHISDTLNREIN